MQKRYAETTIPIHTKFGGDVQGGMRKKFNRFDTDQSIGGAITNDGKNELHSCA